MTAEERAQQTNCTVCEEDQEAIQIEGHPPIHICRDYAEAIRRALNTIRAAGFPIRSLEGYRVGRSKGPADKKTACARSSATTPTARRSTSTPNRTAFYTDCFEFSAKRASFCAVAPGVPEQPGT